MWWGDSTGYNAMLKKQLDEFEGRIVLLEAHKAECDAQHEVNEVNRKRMDDATINNTNSNLLLSKSITEMNVTLTEFVAIVKNGQPNIDLIQKIRNWGDINKWLFLAAVAFAAGWPTLAGLIKGWTT